MRQVELHDVRLSDKSKKALEKFKDSLGDPVVFSIESRHWFIPSDTYEFIDLKVNLEKSFHEFYDIPDDVLIEVISFETGIMSFEKGVYPNYEEENEHV